MTEQQALIVPWLGLVLILLASAIGKLYYKGSVDTALAKLGVTSATAGKLMSAAIAPIEMLIAFWLATGWLWRFSTLATLGLVAVFNVVLWRLQRLGYDGGCGCFGGKSAGPVRVIHLIRNAAMLVAAALLAYNAWTMAASDSIALWQVPGELLLSAGVLLAGLLVVYLLAGAAERLLFRPYWT